MTVARPIERIELSRPLQAGRLERRFDLSNGESFTAIQCKVKRAPNPSLPAGELFAKRWNGGAIAASLASQTSRSRAAALAGSRGGTPCRKLYINSKATPSGVKRILFVYN